MTVIELITELGKLPPDMEVCVWDDHADDYLPIVEAIYEDGTTHIDLLTYASGDWVSAEEED